MISNGIPLGLQKVEEEVNGEKVLSSYQVRYVCLLYKLLGRCNIKPNSRRPDLGLTFLNS